MFFPLDYEFLMTAYAPHLWSSRNRLVFCVNISNTEIEITYRKYLAYSNCKNSCYIFRILSTYKNTYFLSYLLILYTTIYIMVKVSNKSLLIYK